MNANSLQKYPFNEKDRLLIDANVWLYAYGPDSYKKENRCACIYAQELNRIKLSKSQIFINEIILSEFINTFAREKWKDYNDENEYMEFKEYRDSSHFEPIAEDIYYGVDDILSIAKYGNYVATGFTVEKARRFIDIYKSGKTDFNDLILKDICKVNGLILVTNDKDFKDCDVPIITENFILLRKDR